MASIRTHRELAGLNCYFSTLTSFKHGARDRSSVNRSSMHSWGDLLIDYEILASNNPLVCSHK